LPRCAYTGVLGLYFSTINCLILRSSQFATHFDAWPKTAKACARTPIPQAKNGHCAHQGESAQYLMAQAYRADGSSRPTPNHTHAFRDPFQRSVSGLSEEGLVGNKNPKLAVAEWTRIPSGSSSN
jgi:hypothetical protein